MGGGKKKSYYLRTKVIIKYEILFCIGYCLVTKSCLNLCDPMNCSAPGSSVHRFFQARILEWVAISFSKGSCRPRNQTQISCITGKFLHCRWVLYQLSYEGSSEGRRPSSQVLQGSAVQSSLHICRGLVPGHLLPCGYQNLQLLKSLT